VHVLVAKKPTADDFAEWGAAGVDELIWGVPDADEETVLASIARLGAKVNRG
jgi:hypothetical protein